MNVPRKNPPAKSRPVNKLISHCMAVSGEKNSNILWRSKKVKNLKA